MKLKIHMLQANSDEDTLCGRLSINLSFNYKEVTCQNCKNGIAKERMDNIKK